MCEPLTRLGAEVVGVDPSETNIAVAKLHAERGHLTIDYRCTTIEEMDPRERFDIVLAMEVVEHVADVGLFLDRCAALQKPSGMMVVATLNRTWKASRSPSSATEYICAGCRAAPSMDSSHPDEVGAIRTQQARHQRSDGWSTARSRQVEPVGGQEGLHGGCVKRRVIPSP